MKRWRIRGTDVTYSTGTGLVIAVAAIIVGSLGIATWAIVIVMFLLLVLSSLCRLLNDLHGRKIFARE